MSEPSQPLYHYDQETDCYTRTWPDDRTSLEIHQPQRDPFRRLKAEVIARAKDGQLLLAREVMDLLNAEARSRFHHNARAVAGSLNGDGEHLAAVEWFPRLLEGADHVQETLADREGGASDQGQPSSNPWACVKDAPTWLSEPETEFTGLAKDLVAPGAITLVASPRGLGKTQVSHALAVALATGGSFRGERVKPVRVLLLDRDNPETLVKRRLRAWGAIEANNLHVLTRQNAPALQDKAAWEDFPLADYDVLIVDSVGSSTEGITEKEGKQTTEVLATILDLARQGLAILLLQNVTKDGMNVKGRGEWADRVDILYEVRDATGFTPSGRKPWWQELPPAGEAAWAERAARRKGRVNFRLAFVPSKFRLGVEPEPFCIELHLPSNAPWALVDVTERLMQDGEAAKADAERAKQGRLSTAARALAELVAERAAADTPILKTQAETWLHEGQDLRQREPREVIKDHNGLFWTLERVRRGEGKQSAWVLMPKISDHDNDANNPREHRSSKGSFVVTHPVQGQQRDSPTEPAHREASETMDVVVNDRREIHHPSDNDAIIMGDPCPSCGHREWCRWLDGRLLCHWCLIEDRPTAW